MYYWTTLQDRGSQVQIQNGGRYEALRRGSGTPSVKRKNGVIPSSDVPELCVSGSPEASLFAKIQSAQKSGGYKIYKTDDKPDVKPSRASLDFAAIEEFRYNMNKHDSVLLDKYKEVSVPVLVVEHIEYLYTHSSKNSVNDPLADAVKNGIQNLIHSGKYNRQHFEDAREKLFRQFADSYGIEHAERAYGEIPDGVDIDDEG